LTTAGSWGLNARTWSKCSVPTVFRNPYECRNFGDTRLGLRWRSKEGPQLAAEPGAFNGNIHAEKALVRPLNTKIYHVRHTRSAQCHLEPVEDGLTTWAPHAD
jgi:hypothetical protein